jgi:hypothetical protein
MAEPEGTGKAAEEVSPPASRALLFLALAAAYYVVYYVFFALRVREYFRDLLLHFPFFRKLF